MKRFMDDKGYSNYGKKRIRELALYRRGRLSLQTIHERIGRRGKLNHLARVVYPARRNAGLGAPKLARRRPKSRTRGSQRR